MYSAKVVCHYRNLEDKLRNKNSIHSEKMWIFSVLLLTILCIKSLLCHLHLFYNTLFSFYIIFTFGWLAMAVWLETQQWRVQGSLRRHFLALVCSNRILSWEDTSKKIVLKLKYVAEWHIAIMYNILWTMWTLMAFIGNSVRIYIAFYSQPSQLEET